MATCGTTKIVPLVGSGNYATWKVQVQMALKKEGLWKLVTGTEAAPGAGGDTAGYENRLDKALAIIVLSIDTSLIYLLGDNPENPKTVWDKLQNHFQKKSWANKLQLRKKLYALEYEGEGSVESHIKSMIEIFSELSIVGAPVDEEDKVIHLLASLPESYDILVTALEALDKVPSLDTVIEKIVKFEKKNGKQLNNEGAAFTSRGRGSEPRCYECNKIGHFKRDCEQFLKRRKKDKYDRQKANFGRVSRDSSDDEDCIALPVVGECALVGTDKLKWVVDSGATSHMCCNLDLVSDFAKLEKEVDVSLGDGYDVKGTGTGKVKFSVKVPGGSQKCCLDVLYVPDLAYNLFSISRATRGGKVAIFEDDCFEIRASKTDDRVLVSGVREGNLYRLSLVNESANIAGLNMERIWHHRFGHLSESGLKQLVIHSLVKGLNYDTSKALCFCEPCAMGKNHRNPFPKGQSRKTSQPLELVHSDLSGRINVESLGGARHFMTFVDDYSRYIWVYFVRNKDEAFQKFKLWRAKVENSTGNKLKTLRSDGGGEYISKEFETFLEVEGIHHELTCPKTPEQNGVAERLNRTLVEGIRSMMANMPKCFWAEAISTSVYLRNRCPAAAIKCTPYEALKGEKPDVSHLRIFGSVCFAHIPKDERKKLDAKSRPCFFLGYGDRYKGYRLFDKTRSKIIHSRDVLFDESRMYCDPVSVSNDSEPIGIVNHKEVKTDSPREELLSPPEGDRKDVRESDRKDVREGDRKDVRETDSSTDNPRRSGRDRKSPDRYGEWASVAVTPRSFREAVTSPDKNLWKAAMQSEIDSLSKNEVWDLVPLPEGRKVVGSKWVFKIKVGADGTVERHKARLVAQGFSQKPGLDYDETFCAVVRPESIRAVLALAKSKGLILHQMDITTAFLNGTLDEEVFMKQPEGFETEGNLVCRLRKSLYGLKQAPRCWNTTLDKSLKDMGFSQSSADPCIYTLNLGDSFIVLAVYVDDILIGGETIDVISRVKDMILGCFEARDLGELSSFLGIKVDQSSNGIWIGQTTYVVNMLEKFGLSKVNSVSTPVDVSANLSSSCSTSTSKVDQAMYQSAVGSLLYLANWTRPDISFAVNSAARFCSDPKGEHWTAVKRIFRYLKGTISYGILYLNPSDNEDVVGYCDSDWAGDLDDRRSTSGYVFCIGAGPISWRSKKQSCVALSSAEAEYMALASASQEALWIRELLTSLNVHVSAPTLINVDSQSAIDMTKNPKFHGRAKHIDIKYHFTREKVSEKLIALCYCPSSENLADVFTKGLTAEKHSKLRINMNINIPKA